MIKFQSLWDSYPTIQGNKAPCITNGKKNFDDQCAIRLGAALAKNGVITTNLVPKRRHCWQHETIEGHVLAAEELATGYLDTPYLAFRKRSILIQVLFKKIWWAKKGLSSSKTFGLEMGRTSGIEAEII